MLTFHQLKDDLSFLSRESAEPDFECNAFDGEYACSRIQIKAIGFLANDKLSKDLCGVTLITVSDEK